MQVLKGKIVMTNAHSMTNCYRCPVDADRATAILQVGRRRIQVKILDTSIEGFTIVIKPHDVRRLRYDVTWLLTTCNEKCVVHPEWMYNADATNGQLGLRRMQDVTRAKVQRKQKRSFGNGHSRGGESDLSSLALGGMIMLIIAIISLPGIGDDLGTAPRIQSMLHEGFRALAMAMRSIFHS